jgi:hypothetical protein
MFHLVYKIAKRKIIMMKHCGVGRRGEEKLIFIGVSRCLYRWLSHSTYISTNICSCFIYPVIFIFVVQEQQLYYWILIFGMTKWEKKYITQVSMWIFSHDFYTHKSKENLILQFTRIQNSIRSYSFYEL